LTDGVDYNWQSGAHEHSWDQQDSGHHYKSYEAKQQTSGVNRLPDHRVKRISDTKYQRQTYRAQTYCNFDDSVCAQGVPKASRNFAAYRTAER
jgi:hypothetical protein